MKSYRLNPPKSPPRRWNRQIRRALQHQRDLHRDRMLRQRLVGYRATARFELDGSVHSFHFHGIRSVYEVLR